MRGQCRPVMRTLSGPNCQVRRTAVSISVSWPRPNGALLRRSRELLRLQWQQRQGYRADACDLQRWGQQFDRSGGAEVAGAANRAEQFDKIGGDGAHQGKLPCRSWMAGWGRLHRSGKRRHRNCREFGVIAHPPSLRGAKRRSNPLPDEPYERSAGRGLLRRFAPRNDGGCAMTRMRSDGDAQ